MGGLFFAAVSANAQVPQKPKANWQNLDLATDGMFGVSTEKAYNELLKDKKPTKVVVAVIDGGIDINHEDLKSVIWTNPHEHAGNKIDDDKNGYADDIHGWDFIGSAKGDVHYDNLELTRILKKNWLKFAYVNPDTLKGQMLATYQEQQKLKDVLLDKQQKAMIGLNSVTRFKQDLEAVERKLRGEEHTVADFQYFEPQSPREMQVKGLVLRLLPQYKDYKTFKKEVVEDAYTYYNEQLNYHLNLDYESRDIVGDNYNNSAERYYGNNDVTGPDADHGSHVAGIIAAVRDNNIGIKGVADDVAIMSVRTVPNGDERDKDVANAIRYAADNGAKVINMSFGKSYTWDKNAVDEAVKYAMSKDVLLVHAAGNDNEDIDNTQHFPNCVYADGSGTADAWIEVGASGFKDDNTLKAAFSNYGKNTVDLFAPGVAIHSTMPNSTYADEEGTSMAAPVVTGVAALIRSYYPKLTALQVKDVIMKSVVKVDHDITLKINGKDRKMAFADLCKTGGIVNAYKALQLAAAEQNAN